MAWEIGMKRYWLIFTVAIAAVINLPCTTAQNGTEHVVGGSDGWGTLPNAANVYVAWARNNTFRVGDTLVFNFATGMHDVQEVKKEGFDDCSFTGDNAVGQTITNGPARITLSKTGEHFYVCTVGQHCRIGQKLAINVSAAAPSPPGAAPPPRGASAPPPRGAAPSPPGAAPPPTGTPPTTPSPLSPPGAPGSPNTPPSSTAPAPGGGESPPPSGASSIVASLFVSCSAIALGFFL